MPPPERRVLPAAPSSGKEQEQEESVGVLAHEWDWTGRLFLSLGLHSALRESGVWRFCTGKLAE